jgi:hypothetical protein
MDLQFSIYIATKSRWAHLTKILSLPVVPRAGEFVKFDKPELGDYLPWKISQVTYYETGAIEIQTGLLDDIHGRGFSFEDETEFDEYYSAYIQAGWQCSRGPIKNSRIGEVRDDTASG